MSKSIKRYPYYYQSQLADDGNNIENVKGDARNSWSEERDNDCPSVHFNPVNRFPKCTCAQFWQIFRQCFAETVASAMLTFMIVRVGDVPQNPVTYFAIPLTLTLGIWLAGPISGGHVNPSVTLGAVLARLMSPIYLPLYWISQFGGGLAGAALARAYQTVPNDDGPIIMQVVSIKLRFLAELIASSIFILMVLCSADSKRPGVWLSPGFTTSFVVGLTALLTGTAFGPDISVSVNPAAALGPKIILQSYANIWINVLVPFLGSFIAAVIFAFFFCPDACANRAKAIFTKTSFDHSKDYINM